MSFFAGKNKKTINKGEIECVFIKNKNSKKIKMAIKNPYLVHVTIPYFCPYLEAEKFLEEKLDWVFEHINNLPYGKIDENFKTKTGNLIITTGITDTPVIKKTGGLIQFIYPIGADFYAKDIQTALKLAVKKALYIEAKNYLPKRLEELSKKFGFEYNKIALKTGKTRWGSCSFQNNINLNINLMNLDEKYIDYVIIHELCHTVEKNHGKRFWELMETIIPESKKLRYAIKKEKMVV